MDDVKSRTRAVTAEIVPRVSREPSFAWVLHGAPQLARAIIARERFDDWMRRHRETPAVMVSGGGGYGKTSALLSWAQARAEEGESVVWVTIDRELAQRETFWALVLHHVAMAGHPVDDELETALRQPPGSMRQVLPALLLRQFSPDRRSIILVIDNADLAAESPIVDDLIRLAEQNSAMRIIITTREDPGRTQLEARVGDLLAVSPPGLLLLDPVEIAAIAAASQTPLSADECAAIHALTGGWALAVQAELSDRASGPDAVATGQPTERLGFRLVDDLRRDPGFRSLLALSVAEVMDEQMARRMGATAETFDLIDRCVRRGLGVWEGESPRRLRLQPVLRTAMRRELTLKHPAIARRACSALATVLEERGERVAAFAAAVAAEDWPLVVRIYQRKMSEAAVRDTSQSAIVQRIPPQAQRMHPLLQFAVAHDDFANGRRARALQRFESYLDAAQWNRTLSGRRPSVDDAWQQCFVVLTLRLMGRHKSAAVAAAQLMSILERVDDPNGDLDAATSMFLTQAAASMLLTDDSVGALAVLEEAGFDVLPGRPLIERTRILAMRSLVASQRGEMTTTQVLLDDLAALSLPEGFCTGCTTIPSTIAAARVEIEFGRAEAAEAVLDRAEPLSRTSEFWPYLLECAVRARWLRSGPEEATATLEEQLALSVTRAPLSPAASTMLLTLHVDLLLARQRVAEAKRVIANSAHARSRRSALTRSRVRLFAGDPRGAAAIALVALSKAPSPVQLMSFSLIAAAAGRRLGDDDGEVARHRARALDIARRDGLISPLTALPSADLRGILADEPALVARVARLSGWFGDAEGHVELTARERLVLRSLASGRSVAETAAELSVSINTVKSQRQSLYRKLEADGRNAAIDAARRRHLL